MNKKRTMYAAYGSNINIEQMRWRCPNARIWGTGILRGYELQFARVATVRESRDINSNVPILLWEITDKCEHALDRYEGFPLLYRKEYLPIMTDTGVVEAMIYIMNLKKYAASEPPSVQYYQTIRDGYDEVGFDTDVLDAAVIKSFNGGDAWREERYRWAE